MEEKLIRVFQLFERKSVWCNTSDYEFVRNNKYKYENFDNELYNRLNWLVKEICDFGNSLYLDNVGPEEKILNIYKNLPFKNNIVIFYKEAFEELGLIPKSETYEHFLLNLIKYLKIEVPNDFVFRLHSFIESEGLDFNSFNDKPKFKIIDENKITKIEGILRGDIIKDKSELGYLGELYAFENLKRKFNLKDELVQRSIWVSRDIGDGFGYDIFSFDRNGSEILMEVKTTKNLSDSNEITYDKFALGKTELNKIENYNKSENYYIVRVVVSKNFDTELLYLKYDGFSSFVSLDGNHKYNLNKENGMCYSNDKKLVLTRTM